MSGGQSKRLLASETEYYGYMDYSEEQYSDYYSGNIIEKSEEYHEEIGLCVKNLATLKNLFNVSSKRKREQQISPCIVSSNNHCIHIFKVIVLILRNNLLEESLFSQSLFGSHTNCFLVNPILSD